MNDKELRRQIHRAMDARLSGVQGDPGLGRRIINAERKRKPTMKKKMIVILALCLALLLFTSAALALNLNVFELFALRETRLQEIAAPSALEEAPAVTAENDKAGKATLQITNAYYDGDSLLIGYSIENESFIEAFVPTAEQLARMEPVQDGLAPLVFDPRQEEFSAEYRRAVENHTPCGLMEVRVYLKDHAVSGNGADPGPWSEICDWTPEGVQCNIRDYDRLPEALKNQDSLEVCLTACQQITYVYFDGTANYTLIETKSLPPVTVTVSNANAEICHFTGEAAVEGVQARADVYVSAVRVTVRLSAIEGNFHPIPGDVSRQYEIELADGNGHTWTDEGWHWEDGARMSFSIPGLGIVPQTLTACFRIVEDGHVLEQTLIPLTAEDRK